MTTLNTSYDILVDNSQKPMTLGLTVSETTMSPYRSLGSLEYSFSQRAVPGHKYWFRIGEYNVLYFLLSVASRQNLSSHSSTESVIAWFPKPKSSAATLCFCIYDHPGGHLLLMHTFIKWTAVSLLSSPPVRPNKPWFIIHMIYDLSESRSTAVYSAIHLYMHPLQIK